jgi:creatinine amidohydrolase/Fe(II)-dependent formamide hydrolase-like protein
MKYVLGLALTLSISGNLVPGQDKPLQESRVFLEQMSWTQIRDAITNGHTTVIVATGGVEQNGPYVATGKHNYLVRAMAEAVARELGQTLIAPVVAFVPEGTIDPPSGHMKYPGTISLRKETYTSLLVDICSSLKQHGFTDIVLIGDSGGNQRGMLEAARALNAKWKGGPARVHNIPEYYHQDMWSFDYLKTLGIHQEPDVKSASRAGVHSDYHYESILATVDPALIRARERMAEGTFSINGVDLNPLGQTIANGRKLIEYRSRITADAIRKAVRESRE